MPKELLQMNQLEKFYSLIANSRVKIRFTSRSDNYMSFEVKGSHGSAVKSFSIGYYNNEGSLFAVENYRDIIAIGSYGWVKREDGSYCKQSIGLCSFKQGSEGYKLLTDLFNNIKKLDFSTYDGKEFCRETFSPFIKGMRNLDTKEPLKMLAPSVAQQQNYLILSDWKNPLLKRLTMRLRPLEQLAPSVAQQQSYSILAN